MDQVLSVALQTVCNRVLIPSSVNHGILVCIECSGAHRSMGVQISQVCVLCCCLE